ncbi:MAG: SDR family oxidoreductase, partial [Ilumatobacteraceae bacterium]|nr:SDR family oxidoreductase [Ilumatobacteraceae bacterium]
MADLGFDGKVAIITGAGGGLGRQHALLLAKRGALVVVNDLGGNIDGTGGDASAAQKVVDEIKAAGGEAVADHNSVATPEGGAAIVKTAVDTFGRIDIVVNNAGILRDKSFHNMSPDLMNPVFDVHLKGAFHVTQPAWVLMREQGYGRIISTSSAAGIFGNFGQTNYGAAKLGLVGFTRVLAVEGAKYNIKANAIAPLALTRMTEDLMGALADKLDPSQVSPIVAWLAHEDCPVTGQVYSV